MTRRRRVTVLDNKAAGIEFGATHELLFNVWQEEPEPAPKQGKGRKGGKPAGGAAAAGAGTDTKGEEVRSEQRLCFCVTHHVRAPIRSLLTLAHHVVQAAVSGDATPR